MRTILAVTISSLFTFALGQRPYRYLGCSWFDPSLKDKYYWVDQGELDYDESIVGRYQRNGARKVYKDRKSMGATAYHYTIHGGIGNYNTSQPDQILFSVQVDRLYGKGMGQQFRVDFWGEKDVHLVSYWILPQDNCTIEANHKVADVKKITASSINKSK